MSLVGEKYYLVNLFMFRKDPLERDKFDAAASPACLLVDDLNPGPLSFKNVYYVLDYESVRSQKPG